MKQFLYICILGVTLQLCYPSEGNDTEVKLYLEQIKDIKKMFFQKRSQSKILETKVKIEVFNTKKLRIKVFLKDSTVPFKALEFDLNNFKLSEGGKFLGFYSPNACARFSTFKGKLFKLWFHEIKAKESFAFGISKTSLNTGFGDNYDFLSSCIDFR